MGIFCPLIFKKLKGKHKIILGFMDNYLVALQAKYASKVTVKWVWAVCALVSVIADFEPVDVDNAADLQAEMNRLGEFWSQHFVLQDRETPVDNVNGQEAVISWQENYYLSGLPSNVLNMNPWLEQSKGWLDYYESEGTLDARK